MRHRSVEELWYVLDGSGEVWRGGRRDVVRKCDSLRIPPGDPFQFRALGRDDLVLLIATIPAWPGADGAEPAVGPWEPSGAEGMVE